VRITAKSIEGGRVLKGVACPADTKAPVLINQVSMVGTGSADEFVAAFPRIKEDDPDGDQCENPMRGEFILPCTTFFDTDSGNDKIVGSPGVDIVWGGAGDDKILTRAGADEIHAGTDVPLPEDTDNDTVEAGPAQPFSRLIVPPTGMIPRPNIDKNVVFGNQGNDTIVGGRDFDEIHGGSGINTIYSDERRLVDLFGFFPFAPRRDIVDCTTDLALKPVQKIQYSDFGPDGEGEQDVLTASCPLNQYPIPHIPLSDPTGIFPYP
jgi:hypothetical protein